MNFYEILLSALSSSSFGINKQPPAEQHPLYFSGFVAIDFVNLVQVMDLLVPDRNQEFKR